MSTISSEYSNKDNVVKPLNPTDSSKRMRQVLKNGQFQEVPDSEVDYEFTNPQQLFTHELNLIPFQNAVQSQRTFYTSKFWNQAVPIEHGEVPYLQTLKDKDTNETFQNYVGKKTGVVSANENDDGSTVTAITPDEITLKSASGKTIRKPLYNNYSFNRKTYVSNIPIVKVGDKVKKDQILARTNYTDDKGNLAMGLNARVAMVPYKGWTYEDSIVVSEDFAKRMASQHMYGFYQDKDSDAIKTSKPHYEIMFPGKFDKDQLKNIDDNGVVKVGTKVHYGDPLILSTKARMMSSKDQELGRLSKYLKNTRSDASVTWDHHSDGEVTDVVKTKDGWRVNVKSTSPLKEGDKITQLSGNKSTISKIIPMNEMPRTMDGKPIDVLINPLALPCFSSDTEILTQNRGWINVSEVLITDTFATLNPNTFELEYQKASHVHHYTYKGPMYHFENRQLSILVTPNHKQFVMNRIGGPDLRKSLDLNSHKFIKAFHLIESNKIFGQPLQYLKAAKWNPPTDTVPKTFTFPGGSKLKRGPRSKSITVNFDDYLEFMGWFLSEGYTTSSKGKKGYSYVSAITQSQKVKPQNYNQIKNLLTRMGLKFYANPRVFSIFHKGVYEYLSQFGKSHEKFIPVNIKSLPKEKLKIFLDSLFKGDGNIYNNTKTGHVEVKSYTSTSKRLMGDLQELFIKLGCIFNIRIDKRFDKYTHGICYYANVQKGSPGAWANWSDKTKSNQIEEWKEYNGFVHCVTVPNGIVLVRRDGKANFSGNSRVNSSMIQSVLLGKIAEKTGKPYILPSFNHKNESWLDFTENELKKNNIPETEEIYDPILDRTLDQPVTVGNEYFLKLHHIGESKLSSRDTGIYTQDQTPAKGGEELQRAKRLSGLEATALISASAYNIIKDGLHLRGQKNDDYWRAVRRGETPSLIKKSPFVWDKYIALMQGAGINPKQVEQGVLQASPFTDAQFERLQPVELKNPEIIDVKNLKPVEGGLFDPAMSLTNKWGKITLTQPYPNPGFEDAIVSLLGIKKSDMYDIMQGKKNLGSFGTGNTAIYNALKNININEMFKDAKDDFKNAPKSQKQKALNRMRYLQGLQRNNMGAEEYMITRVPVLPAEFRPYAVMGDTFLPGDANELYKDVFQMNNIQKEMMEKLGPKAAQENNLNMYKSIKALYGFGESPNRKLQQRGVSGFLDKLVGGTSKFSYLNRVVNSKPVDQSARSVIEMSPELNMNEIDLPNEMAFKIFAPYIQGELVKQGMRPRDAIKAIKDRDEATAGKALDNIMKDRVVWYSRAPAWHRFNALAAYAKRHEGNNILIPPVVSSGAGADNDGDDQIAYVYVAIKR